MFDLNNKELKAGDQVLVLCEVVSANRGKHPNLLVRTIKRPGEDNDVSQEFAIRSGQCVKNTVE